MTECPICNRDRRDVAKTFVSNAPILKRGVQLAIGNRISCVECGLKVLEKRDARSNARYQAQLPAEERLRATMDQCRKLSSIKKDIEDDIKKKRQELQKLSKMGLLEKAKFMLGGQIK